MVFPDRIERTVTLTRAPRVVWQALTTADGLSAWFGEHKVLHRVNLEMRANHVTSLIGPSGCGKSTFLRILNRMHENVVGAELGGRVLLDGVDIYSPQMRATEAQFHKDMADIDHGLSPYDGSGANGIP